jgi:hypothetical protein
MIRVLDVSRAHPADRLQYLGILGALLLWLTYTRLYWALHVVHLGMPPCPFFYLTGHPCPFCGGTRSFAYMWNGDLTDAVRLYPLGPVLFAGSLVGVGGLAAGIVSGRTLTPNLTSRQWWLLGVAGVTMLAFSWSLKVFVLGN